LGYLIGWLTGARILLLLLYRPEYTHSWGSKSFYNRIGLDQLTPESSAELIRSILAGIKQERANPQEIEGKQALFVLNLPEKKMAGEVSQGMLFDIGYADKITPCLAVPAIPVPNGSRAG